MSPQGTTSNLGAVTGQFPIIRARQWSLDPSGITYYPPTNLPAWRTPVPTPRYAPSRSNCAYAGKTGFAAVISRILRTGPTPVGALLVPAPDTDVLAAQAVPPWTLDFRSRAAPAATRGALSEGVSESPAAFIIRHSLDEAVATIHDCARTTFGSRFRRVMELVEDDADFGGEYLACVVDAEAGSKEEFSERRRTFFRELADALNYQRKRGHKGDLSKIVVSTRRSG